MFVLHKALNVWHLTKAFYRWVVDRNRHHLTEQKAREGVDAEITAYGILLIPVTPFKYLGIVLLVADDEWPVLVRNLRKAWQK